MTKCAHLSFENHLVAIIVGHGGHDRAVGRQRDGRQSLAFHFEATHQFGGEMLSVSG